MSIRIEDHRKEILAEIDGRIAKALEECGMMAEKYASQKLTQELNATPASTWYRRTGALRNSIGYKALPAQKKMIVGAGIHYAPYVEFGTGIYYEGGRRTSWVYVGNDGRTHFTRGMKPRPFIKPAIADHVDMYKKIIKANLQ